jgi:hypothetical protein
MTGRKGKNACTNAPKSACGVAHAHALPDDELMQDDAVKAGAGEEQNFAGERNGETFRFPFCSSVERRLGTARNLESGGPSAPGSPP